MYIDNDDFSVMDAEAVRQAGRTLQGCTGTTQCGQGYYPKMTTYWIIKTCAIIQSKYQNSATLPGYRCAALLHYQRKSVLQGFRCPGVY